RVLFRSGRVCSDLARRTPPLSKGRRLSATLPKRASSPSTLIKRRRHSTSCIGQKQVRNWLVSLLVALLAIRRSAVATLRKPPKRPIAKEGNLRQTRLWQRSTFYGFIEKGSMLR